MDTLSTQKRSEVMSRIRSTGNKSTEMRFRGYLIQSGLKGWTMHPKHIDGKPDFYFHGRKVAIFVDGCFWHGCPLCYRRPKTRKRYWDKKVQGNKGRDKKIRRKLKANGIKVFQVWEHELRENGKTVISKLKRLI